jgi:hypothetical protein
MPVPKLTIPELAQPHRDAPCPLSVESSRGSRSSLCCRLQQSTAPVRSLPIQAMPSPLLKESSREPFSRLRAAVCNFSQNAPRRIQKQLYRALPHHAEPRPTVSTPQREQRREPKPSALPSAAIAAPRLALHRPASPQPFRATPSWGLHQRMPSLIRLLRQACG